MAFNFVKFAIPDVILVKPDKYSDERGYFIETYKSSVFKMNHIESIFVQDNFSFSKKGVIRGLHFQIEPHAQGKLVWVIEGSIYDVAIDLRSKSPSFGKWVSTVLSENGHEMLWIPAGFAHGFQALEDTFVQYKATEEYNKLSEGGIRWNDPDLNITWPITEPIVSGKDSMLPLLREQRSLFH